jgi:hypothetical protein
MCQHASCAKGLVCGNTGTCVAPQSCLALRDARPNTVTGVYFLAGTPDYPAHCYFDPTNVGDGGWTLAMRVNGTNRTFEYASPLWTNQNLHPSSTPNGNPEQTEAKLQSALRVGFTEVGVVFNGKFIAANTDAMQTSLVSLMAKPLDSADTSSNRVSAWRGLMTPPATLMSTGCRKDVLNLEARTFKLRFGLVAEGENDCLGSPNAFIGVGAGPATPNTTVFHDPTISAGSYCDLGMSSSSCNNVQRPAWVFIYVR